MKTHDQYEGKKVIPELPAVHEYAAAICLPLMATEYVRGLKDMLYNKIGGYTSRNSLAHISLLAFIADEKWMINRAVDYLDSFSQKRAPFAVRFDGFDTFSNGTIFLAPDKASKDQLTSLMKACASHFPFHAKKFTNPHISIARGLEARELAIAKDILAALMPDLTFQCDALCLRKHEGGPRQYDIVKSFALRSIYDPSDDHTFQSSLF